MYSLSCKMLETTGNFVILRTKLEEIFFHAVAVSILLYGCTTWTLIKLTEKNLDGTTQKCYKLSWTHPRSNTLRKTFVRPLTSHFKNHPRRRRHTDTSGKARTNSWATFIYGPLKHGYACVGRLVLDGLPTLVHQLWADTGCSLEELPGVVIDDRDWKRERERERERERGLEHTDHISWSLIKPHEHRFVCVHMETNAICCPIQTMQQGFILGGCIFQKRYCISVVCIGNISILNSCSLKLVDKFPYHTPRRRWLSL